MCKLYKSPLLQYTAGFIIVISMPLYTAAILIGGARFIETTLGIPYSSSLILFALIMAVYVVFGGLIAVMYTDAFQGSIMLIGMIVLLALPWLQWAGLRQAIRRSPTWQTLSPKRSLTREWPAGHPCPCSDYRYGSPLSPRLYWVWVSVYSPNRSWSCGS